MRFGAVYLIGILITLNGNVYGNGKFESESMTQHFVRKKSSVVYDVKLANDNSDPRFPDVFRSWWYVELNEVSTSKPSTVHIRNLGHPHYYQPVYSYDGQKWETFGASEVALLSRTVLRLRKHFSSQKVYIARSEPYSYSRLQKYLKSLSNNPFVKVSHVAKTLMGYNFPIVTLANFEYPAQKRHRIWIQARTHPGEAATSFLVEGMIDYLSKSYYGQRLLKFFVFSIAPMHNIDGVVIGNNRVTPKGENLEELWYYDAQTLNKVAKKAPYENKVLGSILSKFQRGPMKVEVALNLHSTNGAPDFFPHFIPHFGTNPKRFSNKEVKLFKKQKTLANLWINQVGWRNLVFFSAGSGEFLKKAYPETWFWKQNADDVLAVTFESTYGRIPGKHRFFTSGDHKSMGQALAKAVINYFKAPRGSAH